MRAPRSILDFVFVRVTRGRASAHAYSVGWLKRNGLASFPCQQSPHPLCQPREGWRPCLGMRQAAVSCLVPVADLLMGCFNRLWLAFLMLVQGSAVTRVLARSSRGRRSSLRTTAPMVERTVSYASQTSEVATLRRGKMLERKIDKEMQKGPGRSPGLIEEFEKVRSDSSC